MPVLFIFLDMCLCFLFLHHGMFNVVLFPILKLLNLPVVPVLYRTVISGDPAVDLCLSAAMRAGVLLPVDIAVILADGVGWRDRIIRKLIILRNLPYKESRFFPSWKLLAEERMEYCPGGVKSL